MDGHSILKCDNSQVAAFQLWNLRPEYPRNPTEGRAYVRHRRALMHVPSVRAQIAGIALARNIPIATRDTGHFANLAARVINPWDATA